MAKKKSDNDIPLERLVAALTFAVGHKPGVERLDRWPLLVHAPSQWGPGVRTEDHGIAVEDIAAAVSQTPDYARIAEALGTTPDHVAQAVDYVIARAPVPEG